ncbi:MAG: O-antigen ligase family protein [Candidatus Krumholzibacteria bacterium]
MELVRETGPSKKGLAALLVASVLLGTLSLTFQYFLPVSLLQIVAAGLGAAVVGFLIFAYPKYGLLGAVFYIYADLTFIFKMHLSYPIVVIVALAVLFRLLRGDELRGPSREFSGTVALFTLLALGSMLFSHDVGQSMAGFSQHVKVIVMVYLVVQLLRTPDDLDLFALVIFLGSIASIILGVLAIIVVGLAEVDVSAIGQYGGIIRFGGTHPNANAAAVYMISALPMGAYLMIRQRRMLYRVAIGLGILVLFAGAVFTFSRQGIFSLVFIVAAILVREARSRKIYVTAFITVFISILLTPSLYWMRILSIGDYLAGRSTDWSIMLRITALKKAWSLFLENPLTGVGMNNFVVRAGSDLFVKIGPHNMYLEILVGMGVVGFLSFLAVHFSAYRAFRRVMRGRSDRNDRVGRFAFYLLLAYLATLISGMFQSITFYYLVWLPVAGGLAVDRIARGAGENPASVKLNTP